MPVVVAGVGAAGADRVLGAGAVVLVQPDRTNALYRVSGGNVSEGNPDVDGLDECGMSIVDVYVQCPVRGRVVVTVGRWELQLAALVSRGEEALAERGEDRDVAAGDIDGSRVEDHEVVEHGAVDGIGDASGAVNELRRDRGDVAVRARKGGGVEGALHIASRRDVPGPPQDLCLSGLCRGRRDGVVARKAE